MFQFNRDGELERYAASWGTGGSPQNIVRKLETERSVQSPAEYAEALEQHFAEEDEQRIEEAEQTNNMDEETENPLRQEEFHPTSCALAMVLVNDGRMIGLVAEDLVAECEGFLNHLVTQAEISRNAALFE